MDMFVSNNYSTGINKVSNGHSGSSLYTNADNQIPFDLSSLFKMIGNNKVAQILTIYQRDAPKEIKQLRAAYEERAVDTVATVAHKLKGSSGLLKANNLYVLLQQIELIAKSGRVNEEVKIAIEAVDCEYKKIEPLIQAELLKLI